MFAGGGGRGSRGADRDHPRRRRVSAAQWTVRASGATSSPARAGSRRLAEGVRRRRPDTDASSSSSTRSSPKPARPQMGGMGVSMAGPTIIVHGTAEQKTEHLPPDPARRDALVPGLQRARLRLGPRLAADARGPRRRRLRDQRPEDLDLGRTTANWMFLLARTDPDAPKHRGISYFLLDFTSPGITVPPLINMAGGARLQPGLLRQRARARPQRGRRGEPRLVRGDHDARLRALGHRHRRRPDARGRRPDRVGRASTRSSPHVALRALTRRSAPSWPTATSRRGSRGCCRTAWSACRTRGMIPNYEASMAKLFGTELTQRIYRTAMKTVGLYGLIWDRESRVRARRGRSTRAATCSRVSRHHRRRHQRDPAQHHRPARAGHAAQLTSATILE